MHESLSANRPANRLTPARVTLLYAVFAALWIVASGHLLNLATADPVLLARFELAKGLAFVAVTSILLYLLLRFWRDPVADPDETAALIPGTHRLAGIFLALALVVPLMGFGIVRLHGPQMERETFDNLRTIADLKATQIDTWVTERVGDGIALADSKGFVARVAELQRSGSAKESDTIRIRLELLIKGMGYESIVLLDAAGAPIMSLGEAHRFSEETLQLTQAALADGAVRRGRLHFDADGHTHVDFVAPLLHEAAGQRRPVGAVLLHMNPARFLFPYIETWPGASLSAPPSPGSRYPGRSAPAIRAARPARPGRSHRPHRALRPAGARCGHARASVVRRTRRRYRW